MVSVVAEGRLGELEEPLAARDGTRRDLGWIAPTLVAAANALAFILVAPNVNDIWAALARESAALHGVGLTYWFSWFGGGTTPGNYSVLTPYLSVVVGAGGLGAIATTAITPLAWIALRRASHPAAGVWVATLCAGLNLWSGRVPFALGSAVGVAAVIAVMRRRTWLAALAAALTVLSSPVSGAFVAIGLAGVVLVRPDFRRVGVLTGACIAASLVLVGLFFGQPGPESFKPMQVLELVTTLLAFLLASPPNYLRASIWLTLLATPLLFFVPNGLGDNVLRLAWYVLPAVVIATAGRRLRVALLAVALALAFSTRQSVTDVTVSTQDTASVAYYQSLIDHLDTMQRQLLRYRLEVVDDGTHTASYALLDQAMLARGWEYQDDHALNSSLAEPTLDATTYKIWLQDNAVGYVAIATGHRKQSPEYALVSARRPGYLHEVWHDQRWTLYQVRNPNPIVSPPVAVVSHNQSQLVLRVPCACRFTVRVHFSGYLTAVVKAPPAAGGHSRVTATLRNDGFGWTTMQTPAAGTYLMSGSLAHGLLR